MKLLACLLVLYTLLAGRASAQSLEDDLRRMPEAQLAEAARKEGDAARGAVVFFQHHMACSKCHSVGDDKPSLLGPDLATLGKEIRDESLVESVLSPSKTIRKGFESVTLMTTDGQTLTGLLVERTEAKVVIRDAARDGALTTIATDEIDQIKDNPLSLMPAGQVNQLASRQQFLDLVRYLIEIRDGGAARARELQPSPAQLTFTLPEYERHIDHAGFIQAWNEDSLKRGEAIYRRVCANCHGTKDQAGSLPTSLRFAEGKFKNGSDPLAMYQTLTRGFGQMTPQTWMVPSQKYDVIHYIRETYLRPFNPSQLTKIDAPYLRQLPKGNTRGPEPSKIEPWSAMDYGPSLTHTYEVPGGSHNFAYKGIVVRLDPGAGGVSRGRHWMVFDTDTLRVAAAWSATGKGENFIDWRGIQFNGEHQIHPRVAGRVAFANGTGPGWAKPETASFRDDLRVEGRDGRRYGPLPRDWANFRGVYHHGHHVVLSYSVGGTDVLEMPRLVVRDDAPDAPMFLRTFNLGPREHDLVLQVAEQPAADSRVTTVGPRTNAVVRFGPPAIGREVEKDSKQKPVHFDGSTYVEIPAGDALDLMTKDFTIAARMKTSEGGTLLALAPTGDQWTPDGQSLFVRDGKLCFDIGWVGVVTGKTKVNDGKWHNVSMTWQSSAQRVRLFVDGKADGEGTLAAKAKLPNSVLRIGFTSPDFPQPNSYFTGELAEVRFYQQALRGGLNEFADAKPMDKSLRGRWVLSNATNDRVDDATGNKHHGMVVRGTSQAPGTATSLIASVSPTDVSAEWTTQDGCLRLKIPAGREPVKFTVWTSSIASHKDDSNHDKSTTEIASFEVPDAALDLTLLTKGGPPRWPQKLETQAQVGKDDGPFAVDVLTPPDSNPWLAQLRFTGLDFFADGRIAACTWDGDVWVIEAEAESTKLRWQRIATGLFQPLGLRIVDGKIHLICRDQLCVLHDLNGDGETDFYECLNNDHQVTEHFHEFAMGLQTDAEGNFYYAKSGRHALAAVVPHHGTLLRVSKDGLRTDILATGFRAANGVCLNPDGSFVVTDQEGFWNPKNRINWVTVEPGGKPKFYGNLFGYTDVTDPSDSAMEPPLCWITNAFDRSPAELLWVTSERWGPLKGSLLNLSYGNGKVFVVPHERVQGRMQGGMIELPIPAFPTGVMRGRFHPADGQLYLCGMFAWAGSATQPGGLYRLRATGKPMCLPVGLHATKTGLRLEFTEPLDSAAVNASNVKIKTWSLKRSAGYGSKHYDEKALEVRGAKLSADGRSLTLDVPEIRPTWCMEIQYSIRTADGKSITGVIDNTIHALGSE